MWMNGYGELKRIFGDLIRRSIHVMKKSNFEPSIIEWFNIDIPHYDVGYWFHIMMWMNGFVTFLSFPCERRDPVSIKKIRVNITLLLQIYWQCNRGSSLAARASIASNYDLQV